MKRIWIFRFERVSLVTSQGPSVWVGIDTIIGRPHVIKKDNLLKEENGLKLISYFIERALNIYLIKAARRNASRAV